MWDRLFHSMMQRLIQKGLLQITYPDGVTRQYGAPNGLNAALTIHDAQTIRSFCLTPELALGEAYMDARLIVEGDAIENLIRLILQNRRPGALPAWVRALDRSRFHLRKYRSAQHRS